MPFKELPFTLCLNSPAFTGSVTVGTKKVQYFKNEQGQLVFKDESKDYYPADGIRIPSLRGILEFWLRSLMGHLDSTDVFEKQTQVFGSTKRQGLTIRPANRPAFHSDRLRFGEKEDYQPFLYLGYGPLQFLKAPVEYQGRIQTDRSRNLVSSYNENHARDAILVDQERSRFEFVARGTKDQIEALRKALTLLHLFGGIGSRSRRGWGSVEVSDVPDGFPAALNADSDLQSWVQNALAGVWGQVGYEGQGLPRFSAFSPSTRIYITQPQKGSYKDVFATFYKHFERVRSYRHAQLQPPDLRAQHRAFKDHDIETAELSRSAGKSITDVPRRLAFGMPYQPGRGHEWRVIYDGRLPDTPSSDTRNVSRRASPLLLKVLRLGPSLHAGVALFLQAEFFGNPDLRIGAEVEIRRNVHDCKLTREFPGYEAVDEFFADPEWTSVTLP